MLSHQRWADAGHASFSAVAAGCYSAGHVHGCIQVDLIRRVARPLLIQSDRSTRRGNRVNGHSRDRDRNRGQSHGKRRSRSYADDQCHGILGAHGHGVHAHIHADDCLDAYLVYLSLLRDRVAVLFLITVSSPANGVAQDDPSFHIVGSKRRGAYRRCFRIHRTRRSIFQMVMVGGEDFCIVVGVDDVWQLTHTMLTRGVEVLVG